MEEITNDGWKSSGHVDDERVMAVGLVTGGALGLLWVVSMVYVIGSWTLAS